MNPYQINTTRSPIDAIDTSFIHYMEKRKQVTNQHMNGSVPDYAFALDNELRSKMDQIPHFYSLCKKMTSTIETRMMQLTSQGSLHVTPTQYPEIYQIGVDCAHRLGIGVPNIYISNDPSINACTYASDNTSPLVIVNAGALDRLTPGELKAIIAHECGHIHNQHMVYQNIINMLVANAVGNGPGGIAGYMLSQSTYLLMKAWSRAGEVSADRAAVICADNIEDAISLIVKYGSGGTINPRYQQNTDLDVLWKQMDMTLNNPTRIVEALGNHPAFLRRVFCTKEFGQSDVLYSWRPDLRKPGVNAKSISEVDERCKKYVNVVKNK